MATPTPLLPLSVVIIAHNEERRIGDCLESVRDLTGDIVVVDGGSRDGTVEVCQERGARVFVRAWRGYADQKNFGNGQARHEWILSLDADERVTPGLAAAIRRAFGSGEPGCAAYSIRFESYFGVRRVRFGAWNPEWHARLFDRRVCDWNADEVHEGLRGLEGCSIGRLEGRVRHLTVATRRELTAKSDRYAALFASKLQRQRRRPHWTKIWFNPAWRFCRDYFLRAGVLDGTAGLAIAWEAARYTHLKYRGALDPCQARRAAWSAGSIATAACAAAFALAAWMPHSHKLPTAGLPGTAVSSSEDDGGMGRSTLPYLGEDVSS
ncbi:MAG: glycosyltransferase family 2 protein [Verrucomicrobia bacterium]|nr:glycosyltransferase family 2 protein [Verrucomicrobiota bacterium]